MSSEIPGDRPPDSTQPRPPDGAGSGPRQPGPDATAWAPPRWSSAWSPWSWSC